MSSTLGRDVSYRPPTEIQVKRMKSSATINTATGTAEAEYFFETYLALRPVGPFRDPRNKTICRFRLEASDRTGISYVVGHNISMEGIKHIKEMYKVRRVEREEPKEMKLGTKKRRLKKKKFSKNKRKNAAQGLLASSNITRIRVLAQVPTSSVTGTNTAYPIAPSAGTIPSPSLQVRSMGLRDNIDISELLRTPRMQPVNFAYKDLSGPKTTQPEEITTFVDVAVEKMMEARGLTVDEKDAFRRYRKSCAGPKRRNGQDSDVMSTVCQGEEMRICEGELDALGYIKREKSTTGGVGALRATVAALTKQVEEQQTQIKQMVADQANAQLNAAREEVAKLREQDISLKLSNKVNKEGMPDLLTLVRTCTEGINLIRTLAGQSSLTMQSLLGQTLVPFDINDAASKGYASCFSGCGYIQENQAAEQLSRYGYTVRSPIECLGDRVEEQLKLMRQEVDTRFDRLEKKYELANRPIRPPDSNSNTSTGSIELSVNDGDKEAIKSAGVAGSGAAESTPMQPSSIPLQNSLA